MKLTPFSLLLLCIAYVHGKCIENPFAEEGCKDVPNIAVITCEGACKCEHFDDPADCSDIMDEVNDLAPDLLNGEKCEDICSASTNCVFFRWDKEGANPRCTLMSKDQCFGWDECPRGHCVSGQAGCHGGDGTEKPLPDTARCQAGVTFVPGAVHWNCRNEENEDVNIYGDDLVPTGTICQTAHKCEEFNKGVSITNGSSVTNDLVVQCNPDRNENVYLWGKADECLYDVGEEAMANNKATLIDPVCGTLAGDLVLNAANINEPGVSLVCEHAFTTDETKVTVTAPNACVLLCNSHHAFSFESELADDGTGVWNKYDVGSDIGDVLNEDDVKCWGFMEM